MANDEPETEIENNEGSSPPVVTPCADRVPLPNFDVENLPPDIAAKKLDIEARLSTRRLNIEEKLLDHRIVMENRIEDFKQSEAIRINKMMDYAQSENWIRTYWRPVMAWIYSLICLFDFVIAPIMVSVLPGIFPNVTYTPWKSLTLENGGMIHLAFAAIIGVSAWTRGQENIMKTKMTSMNIGTLIKQDPL